MRGRKVSVHEGGSRVQLFVQWPRRFREPKVIRQLAAHIDLYPTILELCNAKPPESPAIDGVSLVSLLDDPNAKWKSRLLFTSTNMGDQPRPFPAAVRSDRYRLVHARKSTKWELYDMHKDPGEKNDLADQLPDKVQELTDAYMQWWNDAHQGAYKRLPIPVGHNEQNPVVLNAPESYPNGLSFHHGPGFAHDWLTGWDSAKATAEWDIDVVRSGEYEIEVHYLCSASDAGAKIGVRCSDSIVYGVTVGGMVADIPLPHRVHDEHRKYINRDWSTLRLESLQLDEGRQRLTVLAATKPGMQVMELKSVVLTKKESVAETTSRAEEAAPSLDESR